MDFGPFALISLFYVVLGIRVVYQLVTSWHQTWDTNFTPADRMLVTQAAFFVLMPVGVALHELGHAAMIKVFGGDIAGWGFYGFAGYVSFYPSQFTDAQQIIIAAAGTVVNILLGAAAIAFVLLKRSPARAAINELLIQFTFISLLNALVVYPLLDLASGMEGDWSQMYFGNDPGLSLVILAIHLAILGLMFWAWKSPVMQRRFAALTGGQVSRRINLGRTGTGGARPGVTTSAPGRRAPAAGGAAGLLDEVAERVSSGWPNPIQAVVQERDDSGPVLLLTWTGDEAERAVAILTRGNDAELRGIVRWAGVPPTARGMGRLAGPLNADSLTMAVRVAMEAVERWQPAPARQGGVG